MGKPTLIIDGDIYAFTAAAGAQSVTNWGDDTLDGAQWTLTADEKQARKTIDDALEELREELGAGDMVVCLTDNHNWRKDVLPSYKGNRADVMKPIILPQIREYMREKYGAWQRPGLEGDDLLGILSGLHTKFPGEKIMVTKDKDMSTLPGLHYRIHQSVLGVFEVTEREADMFHLRQGIAGDPTDGYSGCPGMGMTTAEEFLKEPYELVPEEYTLKAGKNKGETRTRWVKRNNPDLWSCILSLFRKAEVSEADAIIQFQVARILRTSDYDFQKKEPKLWQPQMLTV